MTPLLKTSQPRNARFRWRQGVLTCAGDEGVVLPKTSGLGARIGRQKAGLASGGETFRAPGDLEGRYAA